MSILPLVLAPHPIFKAKAPALEYVSDEIRMLLDDLRDTLYNEHGVGIAAPMVGILQPVIVVDIQENGVKNPIYMVNPEITARSEELQSFEEASLSFLGIAAQVSRPNKVTVRYLDYDGRPQEMVAEGFLATVIQHEMDYLKGMTFLDYVSPVKRDMLVRKMVKFKKNYRPHVHGAGCNH
jgi:peptide deformylase